MQSSQITEDSSWDKSQGTYVFHFFGARGGEVLVTLNDWISIAKPDSINVYIVGKGNTI